MSTPFPGPSATAGSGPHPSVADALRALSNPALPPQTLQRIATDHAADPRVRAALHAHPHMYPQLGAWLAGLDEQSDDHHHAAAASAAASAAAAFAASMPESTAAAPDAAGISMATPSALPHTAAHAALAPAMQTAPVTAKSGIGALIAKIAAGLAGVALIGGGGYWFYDHGGLAGQSQGEGGVAAAPTGQAQDTQPVVSDGQLLELLKTAPLGDADKTYLQNAPLSATATPPAAFTGSLASVQDLSPASDSDTVTITNDGRLLNAAHFARLACPHLPLEQQPVVTDVDGDGTRDVVTIVTNPVVHYEADSIALSEEYSALTVYTPNAEGSALTVRSQMLIMDANELFSAQSDTGFADAALDSSYAAGGGIHADRTGYYTAMNLSQDGKSLTVRRVISTADDSTAGEGEEDVVFPVVWQNDRITVGAATTFTAVGPGGE